MQLFEFDNIGAANIDASTAGANALFGDIVSCEPSSQRLFGNAQMCGSFVQRE